MTAPIPADATCVFLYSPQHLRVCDQGRIPRLSFATPDGTKTAYTKEIPLGLPDTEARIAEYKKQFPDANISGYGTCDTQRLVSSPPTLTSAGPR
jgi:hypothetical protein